MVCSHCNQPGHTYRGCPIITAEEKKEKAHFDEEQKKIDKELKEKKNKNKNNF